jgi:hypothetical protein
LSQEQIEYGYILGQAEYTGGNPKPIDTISNPGSSLYNTQNTYIYGFGGTRANK